MTRNTYKNSLILGTSILALSVFAIPNSAKAHPIPDATATCHTTNSNNGTAAGTASSQSLCLGTKPADIPCPPTNIPTGSSSSGGSGGGGNDTGGGWVDTDGDGRGDTRADEAPPGNWDSSSYEGGLAHGSTNINDSGWISGTHDNGIDGRSDNDAVSGSSGGGFCCGSGSTVGGWFSGSSSSSSSSGGSSSSGSSSSGGGYSCMVVTHFYRRGLFSKREWLINKKDALSGRLSKDTINGYHVWAPYAVLAMRKSPLIEKIFFNMFIARTKAIEVEQGRIEKTSKLNYLARLILEIPSITLGKLDFKPDHNYNFEKIYGTHQDTKLMFNKFYVRQPQGMIGW